MITTESYSHIVPLGTWHMTAPFRIEIDTEEEEEEEKGEGREVEESNKSGRLGAICY